MPPLVDPPGRADAARLSRPPAGWIGAGWQWSSHSAAPITRSYHAW